MPPPQEPLTSSLVLVPDLGEVAQARCFLDDVARRAGFDEERRFDIQVACSEAIANAIEHTPTKDPVKVTATIHLDRLEVQIEGPSKFTPPKVSHERINRGLGLPLMASFADHLALYSGPKGGTLVSLTFYRPGATKQEVGALPPSVRELIEENELISAITKNAPVGICVVGADLRYRWANRAYQEFLDEPYRSSDLTGLQLSEAIPGLERAGTLDVFLDVSRTGRPELRTEYEYQGNGRCSTWWRRSVIPLAVDTEAPPYDLLLVLSEETERKQAEAALEEAERRNRELIKCVPSAIYEIEFRTQRFTLVNDAMCAMSGFGRGELLAMSLFDILIDEDRPRFQARMESWLRGEEPARSAEFTIRGKDGQPINAILDVTLTADQNGNPVGAAVIAHDITQRKEAERALRESEERYRILAIENERLYRQQLSIAEGLQLALLNIPSKVGRIHVGHLYRSSTKAAKVGGDFYDFFEVRDGKMAALIGDVAGHGIEAARVASLTKDVIHAFTHQTLRPQEAFKRTNRLLLEKSLPGFVTAFLGVLDPESAVFRYASAGHPSTLLRRREGGIELLGEGSSPLGVFAEASWRMGETQLEVGDVLLLYTDGITEARQNGEFFGEERLLSLLKRKHFTAERLPKLILDKVLEFSGGVLQDDVAILALSLGEAGSIPRSRQSRGDA
jgi:PAS domain S-box-containing protein